MNLFKNILPSAKFTALALIFILALSVAPVYGATGKQTPKVASGTSQGGKPLPVQKPGVETPKPSEDPSPEQPKPETLTIMLTGDLMCKGAQQQAAYDGKGYNFKPSFKYVRKIFNKADFVVGNLETLVSETLPLSKDKNLLQERPYLNAPEEWLRDLKWAGFDGLVLANNHCTDGGKIGITETLAAIDRNGLGRTGLFSTREEPRYMLLEAKGFKIGVLAYAGYFNRKDHFLTKDEQSYMLNLLDENALKADIAKLKEAGAQYIICYTHSGTEYSHYPAPRQEAAAEMMARAGVDYIIGSHPHVLQPADKVHNGKRYIPLIYSMGNFTSPMPLPATKETIILSVTLTKTPSGQVKLASHKYYPCYLLDRYKGESFVLMPQSKYYNEGYKPTAAVANSFRHIRKVVGKLPTT